MFNNIITNPANIELVLIDAKNVLSDAKYVLSIANCKVFSTINIIGYILMHSKLLIPDWIIFGILNFPLNIKKNIYF